jgi:hypothetical protein
VFLDRCPEGSGVPLQVRNYLVTRHESIGIRAVEWVAREAHGPVRCYEAEAIPTVAPRLTDLAALEHDMLNAQTGKLVASRQAGLTGANHYSLDLLH